VAEDFLLGCNGRGVMHTAELPIAEQFRMVAESGAFDYFDRLPLPDQVDEYLRCSAKYKLPLHTASWFYRLGAEEALIERNIAIAGRIGAKIHNIMIFTHHADGHVLTDQEVVDSYLWTWDLGAKVGVVPSYELHVNMWTEDFRRVVRVADAVKAHGVLFNFTMDYSHVNFKIENPEEQDISGVREEVEAGRMILDPFEEGSLCDLWLGMGIVCWAQLRCAAPNGPRNIWARDEHGNPGRAIQYPFVRPSPGQFHSPWHAYKVEPSKQAIRKVLRHHLSGAPSPLRFITTEMINLPDYGEGARYSLFEHNVACARWIRETWTEMKARHAAGIPIRL
jgi:hypothetical protein